jgi:hypothetical protein
MYGHSLIRGSSKITENVFGVVPCFPAAYAASSRARIEVSMPPESSAPTSTAAFEWLSSASVSEQLELLSLVLERRFGKILGLEVFQFPVSMRGELGPKAAVERDAGPATCGNGETSRKNERFPDCGGSPRRNSCTRNSSARGPCSPARAIA